MHPGCIFIFILASGLKLYVFRQTYNKEMYVTYLKKDGAAGSTEKLRDS
jgi:hypothetical protein